MPVLPIIDLLILLGWTTLAAGGILKAIYLATAYRPTLLSLSPIDLFFVAMAFLGLALTLAARTWVRLNEPRALAERRNANSRRAAEDAMAREGLPAPAPVRSAARSDLEASPPAPGGGWQRVP